MVSDMFLIFLGMLIGAFIGVYGALLCVLHIEGMEAWVRNRRHKRREKIQAKQDEKSVTEGGSEADAPTEVDAAISGSAEHDGVCNASDAVCATAEGGIAEEITEKVETQKDALEAACGATFAPKIDGDVEIKGKMKGQDGHYCFLSGKKVAMDAPDGAEGVAEIG